MPYTGRQGRYERSWGLSQTAIVNNKAVRERLSQYKTFIKPIDYEVDKGLLVHADSLDQPGPERRFAFAFDGTPNEVSIEDNFPSTQVAFIQIASVLVDLDRMLGQNGSFFVDPAEIRASVDSVVEDLVFPSSYACRTDMPTCRDSWRAEVYDHLSKTYKVSQIPLLDTFIKLAQYRSELSSNEGGVKLFRCTASDDCHERDIDLPYVGMPCPGCGGMLFPTDALRIHEEVSEIQSNKTAMTRLMILLEHLTMVAHVDYIANRLTRALGQSAFIIDGPLALFGPQAWLHNSIHHYLSDLNIRLAESSIRPPVIVGIEKTGGFAEHANALRDKIPSRTLMMLPNDYIFSHILPSRAPANSFHGKDEYYGQKFFYKTAEGHMLTITVPPRRKDVDDPHDPRHYPTLPDTLALLDRIGTMYHIDAVIPVALAHRYAAISLSTGSDVLRELAKKMMIP